MPVNRLVILGGLGFIGQNLLRKLSEQNDFALTVFDSKLPAFEEAISGVTYLKGDFSDSEAMDHALRNKDTIVHLISTSVPATESNSENEIKHNVIPSVVLFEKAVKYGVKQVIFLSSGGTIYGNQAEKRNSEEQEAAPLNSYGLQKLMIEEALKFMGRTSNLDYRIIRLANPYGPGQNPEGPLGLVTKLVYRALKNQPITIFGDGSIVRDFIYIDDAIQGIIDIMRLGDEQSIYNLGTGKGTSINEVLETLQAYVPKMIKIDRVDGRAIDAMYSVLDNSKFLKISSLKSFTTLYEGIERTATYFSEKIETSDNDGRL